MCVFHARVFNVKHGFDFLGDILDLDEQSSSNSFFLDLYYFFLLSRNFAVDPQ
jgi:hypothetical protein